MDPVDAFLRSVRGAFATKDAAAPWIAMAVALVAAGATAWAFALVGRRRYEAKRLRTLAKARGLSANELGYVVRLARRSQTSPGHVLTRLEVFDRVTSEALADEEPTRVPPPDSEHAHIARLRRALGFHVLPPHHWLLTTRELAEGDGVYIDGVSGRIELVNETCFIVRSDAPTTAARRGETLALEIVRQGDARYKARCRVVESTGYELTLAHDEHPERIQLREHVRVRAFGPVSLTHVGTAAAPGFTQIAQLIDVSVGGLSVDAPSALPKGTVVLCSFSIGQEQPFEALAATVLGGAPLPQGRHNLRLAFTGLAGAEDARLARAVAFHERHGPKGTDNL